MTLLVILGVIVAILLSGFRIAQEYQRSIIFRLGRFQSIKGPGLYWIIPLVDAQQRVDIRTKTVDLEQQETITKDSVTIKQPPPKEVDLKYRRHSLLRFAL
jgi:regulator of protease activity HflC (stomatin/prohibitin superfamily)